MRTYLLAVIAAAIGFTGMSWAPAMAQFYEKPLLRVCNPYLPECPQEVTRQEKEMLEAEAHRRSLVTHLYCWVDYGLRQVRCGEK